MLAVWNELNERPTQLRLVDFLTYIELQAVDASGKTWHVLQFDKGPGECFAYPDVPSNIGLKVNEFGRLVVKDIDDD